MRNLYIYVVGLAMFGISCRQSEILPIDRSDWGYDYAPIEVGMTWEYQLDSIIYDPEPNGVQRDTISYLMKLQVTDTFQDIEGDKSFLIERYLRQSDTSPWQIRNVWRARLLADRFIWSEGNLDYIKLAFPLRTGSFWEGNALFTSDDVNIKIRGESLELFKFWRAYRVETIGDSIVLNGHTFGDVLTVSHVDREILIEKRKSVEVYAKDIGLVYKRMEILDTQDDNTSIPFEERAEKGFILEMALIK